MNAVDDARNLARRRRAVLRLVAEALVAGLLPAKEGAAAVAGMLQVSTGWRGSGHRADAGCPVMVANAASGPWHHQVFKIGISVSFFATPLLVQHHDYAQALSL